MRCTIKLQLLNGFRNLANRLKMPEKDKTQRHRKKNTKIVRIRLCFIVVLLARTWKDWCWICAMWWSRTQRHTWRFQWPSVIFRYNCISAVFLTAWCYAQGRLCCRKTSVHPSVWHSAPVLFCVKISKHILKILSTPL